MKKLFTKRNITVGVIVIMAIIIGCLVLNITRKDNYIKQVEALNSEMTTEEIDQSNINENIEEENDTSVSNNVTVTPQVTEEDIESSDEETYTRDNENNQNTDIIIAKEVDASFFETIQADREKNREESKERLKSIIESTDILEDTKTDAVNGMITLNSIIEKEDAAEMILEARGYDSPIVYFVEGKVDVVIATESLNSTNIEEIKDAVKSKTDIAYEDISITPVKVKQ